MRKAVFATYTGGTLGDEDAPYPDDSVGLTTDPRLHAPGAPEHLRRVELAEGVEPLMPTGWRPEDKQNDAVDDGPLPLFPNVYPPKTTDDDKEN